MAAIPPQSILPQYPELILAAIEAIDTKNGANKSKISKQIESSYGTLPAAHSTLLSHHLNKMKASGQLVVIKNNYVRPDPNAPPRRGRGRPPKQNKEVPAGVATSPARSRGRPPKAEGESAGPVKVAVAPSVSGRKRGRPPKDGTAAAVKKVEKAVGERRGRGRPPKAKNPV
uniref:HMG-Y-related protein A n=1 Tax=Erigeron canadensis TaxID=72917 RepID=UPI001CB88DF4|nr:HMG-Y-related protein A [Erigeron canadensis]